MQHFGALIRFRSLPNSDIVTVLLQSTNHMPVNEISKTNNGQIKETDNKLCQYCTRYERFDSAREHLRNKALIEILTFVSDSNRKNGGFSQHL